MTDLVIFSLGPFAKLMHYYFTHDSDFRVVAFTADAAYLQDSEFCGLPAFPIEELTARYPPGAVQLFVAIGYRRMRLRQAAFERAKALGYRLPNYISRRAIVHDDLEIGANNVVMPNTHLEPFVKIGDHNLFWSDTLVCHDVVVGDGNYVAAKCVLGGGSTIGNGCFLGNGTILINNLNIASETHTLPGSILFRDTRECHKYMGNPADAIGSHKENGIVIERG